MFAAHAALYTGAVPLPKGSVYFDGSGDYLRLAPSSGLVFGTGDFTVEFWVYPQSTGYQQWFTSPGNGDRSGIAIGSRTGSLWWLFGDGSSWIFERTAGSLTTNAWQHVAVTRSGSTARLFCNGSQIDSISNSTSLGQGTSWDIGALVPNSYWLQGWLSNVRAVKGTALYNSAFTVPASPLTAISGTTLLTCQNPASIVDNGPNALAITANGDATASASNPFS